MNRLPALPLLALLSIPALAQRARLESFTIERDGLALACTEIEGATGPVFFVLASASPPGRFDPDRAFLVGRGTLDAEGRGELRVPYPRELFGPDSTVELYAAYRTGPGSWAASPTSTLRLTDAGDCSALDIDHRPGLFDMQKGEAVTSQFAAVGLALSANNNRAAHPDKAIVFDPLGDATNADPDLHTDFGKLLIIAENDVDADHDGLVDVPDDEANGGQIFFDFDGPVDLQSLTVVDVDGSEVSRVHLRHAGGGTTTLDLLTGSDGNVQELELAIYATDVVRMTVELGGSGGIPGLRFSPCPQRLDLDETPSGIPLAERRAGEKISDQYACLGVTISAHNDASGHPHEAILFDSSNPTGGDDDLATPGAGANNDEALGLLLVIAESAVDGNGDGLVDVPDDEQLGGELFFDFATDVSWYGATLLDIDDGRPSSIQLFASGGALLRTIPLPNLGNGSVQTIDLTPPVDGVRQAVVNLGGSGALAEMRFCPAVVD